MRDRYGKDAFAGAHSRGKSGDPLKRAWYIARGNPRMPARHLAKLAGIRLADAKQILEDLAG